MQARRLVTLWRPGVEGVGPVLDPGRAREYRAIGSGASETLLGRGLLAPTSTLKTAKKDKT